jgi:DNA-binding ferritin-like protein
MSKLVHDFLEFSAQIKIYHWQTKVFARHKASDSLFGEINEKIDKFVEVYIGKYERPSLSGENTSLNLKNLNDKQIVEYLKNWVGYLNKTLPSMIDKNDTDLLNIRDDMLALINQTLYLFTFS